MIVSKAVGKSGVGDNRNENNPFSKHTKKYPCLTFESLYWFSVQCIKWHLEPKENEVQKVQTGKEAQAMYEIREMIFPLNSQRLAQDIFMIRFDDAPYR